MIASLFTDMLTGGITLYVWVVFAKFFRVCFLDDCGDGGAVILSFVGVLLLAALAACLGHWILELK
jgi:hypothetical protein